MMLGAKEWGTRRPQWFADLLLVDDDTAPAFGPRWALLEASNAGVCTRSARASMDPVVIAPAWILAGPPGAYGPMLTAARQAFRCDIQLPSYWIHAEVPAGFVDKRHPGGQMLHGVFSVSAAALC